MTPEGIKARLDLARQLAEAAGQMALERRRLGTPEVESKAPQDFVTEIDREVEAILRQRILAAFPRDGVLGEEFGASQDAETAEALWVIDPIDGTANFIHDLPDWAVSIGIVADGQPVAGAIFDAGSQSVSWAGREMGAFRDGEALHCTGTTELTHALVMVGMSGRLAMETRLDDLRAIMEAGAEFRRHGSAATGLLRVADGRVGAYVERHLNAWDVMGGIVIAREAGALTYAPDIARLLREGGPVLCAAPMLAPDLAKVLGIPAKAGF